ncbi:phage holin family protein [Piscinibacter sakaiensis]|uniref:phage holin family protein n=1 Tax=Piscinibacter sakaiensis TaxID=1547922 RepID=UPI003AAD274E
MSGDPGLFDAGRRLAGTALAIFQSRLELATLEIGEARSRILSSLAVGLFGVLLLVCGIVALSLCVVWLLWPEFGVWALAGMGVVYLLVGIVMLMKLRQTVRGYPQLLEMTHAELRRDAVMLRGSSAGPDQ